MAATIVFAAGGYIPGYIGHDEDLPEYQATRIPRPRNGDGREKTRTRTNVLLLDGLHGVREKGSPLDESYATDSDVRYELEIADAIMNHHNPVLLLFLATILNEAIQTYQIWPYPGVLTQQSEFFSINPANFTIHIKTKGRCEILEKAIDRYKSRMFVNDCSMLNAAFKGRPPISFDFSIPDTDDHVGQLSNVIVNVEQSCESTPQMDMNERYSIRVSNESTKVWSRSVWGAIRGLETLSQLIKPMPGTDGQFKLNFGRVDDSPRFGHRGLLIDSARHFLPLSVIYATLDAMELNKLNVLHWHLSDDQSFPFVSKTFPELSERGAFRQRYVYTVDDVKNVIEYARLRGIRVVPEFDTPGHTQSWGKGQPNFLTQCYERGKATQNFGPANPAIDSTYSFMQKFLLEINDRFPDQAIHLGGHEFDVKCWESNPVVQQFVKKQRFGKDSRKLLNYYFRKLFDIVHNWNKTQIVWQDVFNNKVDLKSGTIVQISEGDWQSIMKKVTGAGHQVILSACWILDRNRSNNSFWDFYQCDPGQFKGSSKERKLVLGGEASLWGNFVDGSNLVPETWPRASAVAERLWSNENVKDRSRAQQRLHDQRCRMQILGFHVPPIDGTEPCWCDDAFL